MDNGFVLDVPGTRGSIGEWGMADPPRIRSITGVRIRQFTLPESLHLASKLHTSPSFDASSSVPEDGYFLGESSHTSSSPDVSTALLRRTNSSVSRRSRRISLSELGDTTGRARAGSSSTLGPIIAINGDGKERVTRPRSKTLAGEALDHEKQRSQSNDIGTALEDEVGSSEPGRPLERRSLARCFIAFRLPDPTPIVQLQNGEKSEKYDLKGKSKADNESDCPPPLRRHPSIINTRPSRSSSLIHPSPTTPNGHGSQESSRPTTPTRVCTTSMNTIGSPTRSKTQMDSSPTSDSVPRLGQRPPRLVRTGSDARPRPSRPVSMISRASYRSPHLNGIAEPKGQDIFSKNGAPKSVPFFLSAIHPPSSHPTFPSLLPASDFASWLSTIESAAQEVIVEVWYEDLELGWSVLPGLGGLLDLRGLQPVHKGDISPNSLQFSLRGDTEKWYSIPALESLDQSEVGDNDTAKTRKRGASVRGVIERSVRETRMKKGVSVGTLHQFVHDQSVVADIKANIEIVRVKINALLQEDADRRALRRDVNERSERIKWIQSKIDEVDKLSKEVSAAIIFRQKAISDRRQDLIRAESQDDLDRSAAEKLLRSVHTAQDNRAALIPLIHHYRAHHVQTLDALFPILPLSPSILLYGILAVPLPIPSGKDPAPPTMLPPTTLPEGVKVDERTTAAALGYVAMVIQILGNLGGNGPGPGGLVYPVTCAGSRSLVRDVVSVMQGPRSFPLYTKGVERYRFDYAVFLLNTNIELLMQEANIRLLDRRHTLPNLKSLLLTLSSPTPPPSSTSYHFGANTNSSLSGTTTYNNSRIGSRQTSYTYPAGSPSAFKQTSSLLSSPAGSARSQLGRENGLQGMSPVKSWNGGKRSGLSRQSFAGSEEGDEESVVSRLEMLDA